MAIEWAEGQLAGHRKQGEDFFRATDSEKRQFVECLPRARKLKGGLIKAVDVLLRLENEGLNADEAIDFAVKHLKPQGGLRTLGEVIRELRESKELRYNRGDLRKSSYEDFRIRSSKLSKKLGDVFINELDKSHVKSWLADLGGSPRTTKNYLATASEVFKHGNESGYLVGSPLDKLTTAERKELIGVSDESEPSILTIDEARRLLSGASEHGELDLLPAVTLGLFCGIRTEELKRLDWRYIRDRDSHPIVTVSGAIAKKRRIRHVEIPANALMWLSLCRSRKGRVACPEINDDYQKRFTKLLKITGFIKKDANSKWGSTWAPNAMRHSFGSYHFALHGNSLETSRQLGHRASDQVLFDHYRALATKEQAELYFAIKPEKVESKIVRIA